MWHLYSSGSLHANCTARANISPPILKSVDMGRMLSSPLVGKWSMSGYVKVVRRYGASLRTADCLNSPLWIIEASVRHLAIDTFLTDVLMNQATSPSSLLGIKPEAFSSSMKYKYLSFQGGIYVSMSAIAKV
jgi:hypothetical protein